MAPGSRKTKSDKTSNHYQSLFEHNVAGVFLSTTKGRIIDCNQAFARILGCDYIQEVLDYKAWDFYFAANDREKFLTQLRQHRLVTNYEVCYRRKDGNPAWVLKNATLLEGSPPTIAGTVIDITERKRARQSLEESRRTLSALLANLPGMAYRCQNDPEWTMEFVSEGCHGLTGYDPSDLVCNKKVSYGQLIDPEDHPKVWERIQTALVKNGPYRMVYRIKDSNGREKWVWEQGCGVLCESQLIAREGFITDITERVQVEERLRQSEEQFRLISENVADLIALVDLEGKRIYNSPSYKGILGDPDALRGTSSFNEIHPEDRDSVIKIFTETVRTGFGQRSEFRFLSKDGGLRFIESQGSVIKDRNGKPAKVLIVSRDVTERRQLTEQLSRSQKMEAIGRLAGGVAHDFNNLLTIISGYTQLGLDRMAQDDPTHANMEEIKKAADRAASLTRQLLAFSRQQVMAPQVLDLNAVIENMEKMLRRLIGEDIELMTLKEAAPSRVKADPGQIEQVIMNLAVNARDAMPQGGKLMLETANIDLDDSYSRSHAAVVPGRYVMLAVSDTGTGMDAETQKHLFEPFFTTKERGKGTGLGLATVYGIIKQSGGYIWAYSEVDHGTTFKIYLPCAEGGVEVKKPEQVYRKRPRGTETVLVIEDEDALRALIREVLQSNGYTVLDAGRGEEAVRLSKAHKGAIHLLITDVVMPQMSGPELVKRLAPERRGMKVIYISGYTDDIIVQHGILEAGTTFLQKPFTPDALQRKVWTALHPGKGE